MSDDSALEDLVDELKDEGEAQSQTTVADIMDAVGHRGSGVFLFVPALIGASPVGVVPTVPTICAVIIAIFAVQIALGKDRLWMPDFLEDRGVEGERLSNAMEKVRGVAETLDGWFGKRLTALTGDAAKRVAAVLVLALCAMVPPLEVVPGAAILPLGGIALFGLALLLEDGVAMLLAFVGALGALWFGWTMI